MTHDDQLRQLGYMPSETPADSEGVSVQLTPTMVRRAVVLRPDQLAWRSRSQGGMKAFLQMSRTIQRLPSIGKGRRE